MTAWRRLCIGCAAVVIGLVGLLTLTNVAISDSGARLTYRLAQRLEQPAVRDDASGATVGRRRLRQDYLVQGSAYPSFGELTAPAPPPLPPLVLTQPSPSLTPSPTAPPIILVYVSPPVATPLPSPQPSLVQSALALAPVPQPSPAPATAVISPSPPPPPPLPAPVPAAVQPAAAPVPVPVHAAVQPQLPPPPPAPPPPPPVAVPSPPLSPSPSQSAAALESGLGYVQTAPASLPPASAVPPVPPMPSPVPVPPPAPQPPSRGRWTPAIEFPVVPVAAAVVADKLLVWSSDQPNDFPTVPADGSYTGSVGLTYTSFLDLASNGVSEVVVTNTQHDMFCPGISMLSDGRVMVTGGVDNKHTSVYDPIANDWVADLPMNIGRGYQATAALSDGRIFVIGGSWTGGLGGKNGEMYTDDGTGWRLLPGCSVTPMLTDDYEGVYRADNHGWLFGWSGGSLFQAGPSKNMNWYDANGNGSTVAAGLRGTDDDAMCGNAVMFDAANGKILTVGGSPSYVYSTATANASLVTIGAYGTPAHVQPLPPMAYARAFASGVVLPDGSVLIVGGQPYPVLFSDADPVLVAELWSPATRTFAPMAPIAVPRNYHSVAVLLPDGTVFSGGGGLCGNGCSVNHLDGQIFTPPYLLDADGTAATRPNILASPTDASPGDTLPITTDVPIVAASIIRRGTSTHTVNTDQRRVSLTPTPGPSPDPQYLLKLPADPGIVLPGLWLLFVMDAAGVPSVAADLKIKILATPAPPAAPTAAAAAARTPAAASNAAITAPAPVVVGAALQPAVSAGG